LLIPEKRIEEDTYSLIIKYSVKKLKQNIIVITDHRDDYRQLMEVGTTIKHWLKREEGLKLMKVKKIN
jgi:hypothetical protein